MSGAHHRKNTARAPDQLLFSVRVLGTTLFVIGTRQGEASPREWEHEPAQNECRGKETKEDEETETDLLPGFIPHQQRKSYRYESCKEGQNQEVTRQGFLPSAMS